MRIRVSQVKAVLIIQIRPYGDVLLNTGYLPDLRQRFPEARIDFLVQAPYHYLVAESPYLDGIIVYRKGKGLSYLSEKIKLIKRVAKRRYDLIIDQQRSNTSAQVVLFSGATYRIGSSDSRRRWVYNIKVDPGPARYAASMKFDLLAPLGIQETSYHLYYKIQSSSHQYIGKWLRESTLDSKTLICISPGSPRPYKMWRLEHYAKLADMLLEKTDCGVILIWAPDEWEHVQSVAAKMDHTPVIAPPTDYNQAAALIRQCALLVCNDGGLNHLAVALDVPSLAIFGNTNPQCWMPPSRFAHHYFLFNPNADSRRDDGFGISPLQAFEKVNTFLKKRISECLPGGDIDEAV